jgi:hypothetical protein
MLRRAGPLPQNYRAGDTVCLLREQGATDASSIWAGPAKIIGFEGKTTWLSYEGTPIASSVGRLRPCTQEELLGNQLLYPAHRVEPRVEQQGQKGYLDARGTEPPRDEMIEPGGEDEYPELDAVIQEIMSGVPEVSRDETAELAEPAGQRRTRSAEYDHADDRPASIGRKLGRN